MISRPVDVDVIVDVVVDGDGDLNGWPPQNVAVAVAVNVNVNVNDGKQNAGRSVCSIPRFAVASVGLTDRPG